MGTRTVSCKLKKSKDFFVNTKIKKYIICDYVNLERGPYFMPSKTERIYLRLSEDIYKKIKKDYDGILSAHIYNYIDNVLIDLENDITIRAVQDIEAKLKKYYNILKEYNDLEYIKNYNDIYFSIKTLIESLNYQYNPIPNERKIMRYSCSITKKEKDFLKSKLEEYKFSSFGHLVDTIMREKLIPEIIHNHILVYNQEIIRMLERVPRRWNLFQMQDKEIYHIEMNKMIINWSQKINGSYTNE